MELCKSCSCDIARQRGPLGSETLKSRSNPGSDHGNPKHPSCDETCALVKLQIRDVGSPGVLTGPCLIPLVCSLAIWLQTNEWILSTSRLKHPLAIDSFGPHRGLSLPVRIITLRAELLIRKQWSSASHCQVSLRVSARF